MGSGGRGGDGRGGGREEGQLTCGSGVTTLSSHWSGLQRALVAISFRLALPIERELGFIYTI